MKKIKTFFSKIDWLMIGKYGCWIGVLVILFYGPPIRLGNIGINFISSALAADKVGKKITKKSMFQLIQEKAYNSFLSVDKKLDFEKIFATGTLVILYGLIIYLTYEDIYKVQKPLVSPPFIPKVCLPKDLLVPPSSPCTFGPHTVTNFMLQKFLEKMTRPELSPSFAYFLLSEASKNAKNINVWEL